MAANAAEIEATIFHVQPLDVLIISIIVLYVGVYINSRVKFLRDYYIPPAVVGGLLCSLITLFIYNRFNVQVDFDMNIRDVLLLGFFSTVGLSAKFSALKAGGISLVVLTVIAGIFLMLQDFIGIALALMMDVHPGYGLMAGSVSLAGGHGTAIAWGTEADKAGLVGASEIGLAFATFGLIAGGIVGGPLAKFLIERHKISYQTEDIQVTTVDKSKEKETAGNLLDILDGILVLALCIGIGHSVNEFLFGKGVLIPGFLASMGVGIVITNLVDVFKVNINSVTVDKFGEVCLNIFLSMSLMSMQLWTLASAFGAILAIMLVQVLVIALFTIFVVFRTMGKNYDAAVISSGFVGLGLGATPVAIANMTSVTTQFGPSIKAFLVIPLVGAFFIDIMNAAIIKFYIGVITDWLL